MTSGFSEMGLPRIRPLPTLPSPSLPAAFKTALLILIFLLPLNGNESHEDYTMFR